ncbi:MAG: superoxide dismutase [Alphaproteobacteria bacterium]
MSFSLPKLDYDINALAPHMSAETLEYHHGLHHQAYITNMNAMIEGTPFADKPLEEIVIEASKDAAHSGLFNNAAQNWNHNLFWKLLTPNGGQMPGKLEEKITEDFGSVNAFKEMFTQAGLTQFGSGWAWLVLNKEGKLEVMKTPNAENPLPYGKTAIFALDVWEHSYYIDYRNRRGDFIKAVLENIANWEYAQELLLKA